MSRTALTKLAYFLGCLFVPPAVISCGVWLFMGPSAILPSFLCAFGVDLIAGMCVNGYVTAKTTNKLADLEKARMEYERGHLVGVSCATCGARNIVPLDLTIDGFECTNCHSKNKIFYEFRATSSIDVNREAVMKAARERLQQQDSIKNAWDGLEEVFK